MASFAHFSWHLSGIIILTVGLADTSAKAGKLTTALEDNRY
jgi:hypothetical protein